MLLGAALLALAPTSLARADVALVQVVQSQTARGGEGSLAKNLLEVSGGRVRLVAALARKLGAERAPRDPERQVELLDLSTTAAWLIDADLSARARPAGEAVPLERAGRAGGFEVILGSVTAILGDVQRRSLGVLCSHVRVVAPFSVRGPRGRTIRGRLEQDAWLAPATGDAQKGLLDLIAFETAFRRQTGARLTPLDRQTYRVREAGGALRLRPEGLERVAAQAREALSGIPGYPVSSSITWWREPWAGETPIRRPRARKRTAAAPKAAPAEPPPTRQLVLIDWDRSWKQINELEDGRFGRFPLGPLPEHGPLPEPPAQPAPAYDEFRREMLEVLDALDVAKPVPLLREPAAAPRPSKPGAGPRYEVFSDMTEMTFVAGLPHEHFELPAGIRRKK